MKTSIRDVLRRERWDANRKAHEAELALLGSSRPALHDEGDDVWMMVIESYVNGTIAEGWRRLNEQLVG